MHRPIRILHIFGRMQRGGAEMRTLDVMRHIDREGCHLDFCALSGLAGSLDDEIRLMGGQVHLVRLRDVRFPQRFISLLRHQKYDVVHSHVHHFSGFMLLLAAIAKIPTRIAHFRSSGDGRSPNLRRRLQSGLMKSWIDRYATKILAVSNEAMSAAWGTAWHRDTRCHVIYNGIDTSAFPQGDTASTVSEEFGLNPAHKLFIHVGRIDAAKNHNKVLSVFSSIFRREPAASLLIVGAGRGDGEQLLKDRALSLGISDAVHFAGERTDVPRLLKAAGLMIFPSIREGLPGAVLEACAVGTPVLASDIPVIKEIAPVLPRLQYTSVNDTDENWADLALSLYNKGDSGGARQQAIEEFKKSPFTIENCTDAFSQVWQRRDH